MSLTTTLISFVPGAAHESDCLLVAEEDRLAVVALEAVRAVRHPLEARQRLLKGHPLLPACEESSQLVDTEYTELDH